MELGRLMGSLHPVLIHFPIVLLLTAVGFEAAAFFTTDHRLGWAARLILLVGAVSTLFAFVCGNFAELWAARSGISQDALEYHELLATLTSWAFVGLTGWRLLMRDGANPTPRIWRGMWLCFALFACVGLGFTGYHGGELVYRHAAAVQGIGLQRIPTHEDLFNLTQRQDSDSIFYSNMMHHVFGWMVLLLSGLLMLDLIAPKAADKTRRFAPLLLLAGGAFLLVFSDQDAWPLYHIRPFRPITDKEVILHKTYAVLMLAIGIRGAWGYLREWRRRSTDSATVPAAHAEQPAADQPSRFSYSQNRLMAVFALVGGALLFTHVHSAAPYANIACGVYIHHTVMGLVALSIGAVKLLDDAIKRQSVLRQYAYPALMCLESILLINYNEGLPWFLGYGGQSSVAAHGGLVAPLGKDRAELVYHPESQRIEVFIEKPESGESVRLPIATATAVVSQGEAATEVPLAANPGGETSSAHFAARAPFLRGAPIFSVAAKVMVDGREATADFEPWIDPSIANINLAAWVCPMHPSLGSAQPGRCRVCGMALEPRVPRRASGALHDPDYRMDLSESSRPFEGRPTNLTFSLRQLPGNSIVRGLEVVHTKRLHLIVVSSDLATFDHVHPIEQPDGRFVLNYTFLSGGDYSLFADVTPSGAGNQVFRLPLHVDGPARPEVALRESPAPSRLFGDYRITLTSSPSPPKAGDESSLTFNVEEGGEEVTDLEPYLGAGGHCVILSSDSLYYLHCHPVEAPGSVSAGPRITFHTRIPRPGLYKVWGQFQHRGKVIIADFVIRVP